ncbi:lipoprotein LpqV [uncultured Mycolicibacterium sp.]|uniref:lipoprotein LpqV n=1 Tax=uncultured Mycolicibacterium sp. TaxID=2320817 RepID=UPI00260B0253|nr:lipoprotein LpqV [uncultured Mycolicibacterium sp.]
MRAHLLCATGVLAAVLAGCSSDPQPAPTAPSTTPSTAEPTTAAAPPPGEVALSPGGVTTAVGAPAESTEEEYFQACYAAKTWMDARGGDPHTLIEPYLAELQATESSGPGTFGSPWSRLAPGRQAAVIVAVRAAADGLCG